ncbi:MAG: ribonuclease HII [Proteobacteria bacterium]|nr:ribonuclease HII [Pseudomonadota bacterium]
MPDLSLEGSVGAEVGRRVAGVDEAGRGPLAGPVVAAAVVLGREALAGDLVSRLDDSKRLARAVREALYAEIASSADCAVGIASVAEVDSLNVLRASFLAMARAVAALGRRPDVALVDGNRAPRLPCRVRTVVRGDSISASIAAASIVAKVTRDRIMAALACEFPGYGWERNAGYATAEHRSAIARLGVTPHHRRSFAPILEALAQLNLPLD